jgi:hypothetical protein
MTGGNIAVGGARVWTISVDRYTEVMEQLPASVKRYMLYDVASSFSEEAVLQFFQMHGEEATLWKLQYDQRMETLMIYGREHPGVTSGGVNE